jgi:hypothetical protein
MGVRVNFINPKDFPPMESKELEERISSIDLPKNRTVMLVAEDMTRPDYTVCTLLFDHIIKQVGRQGVILVIGNGMHRAPTRDELMRKFGWNVQFVRTFFNNPMCDRDWLSELKDRENAYVVSMSTTFPHMHVGMSGGDKVILPGCSHWNTIRHFHGSERHHAKRVMREVGSSIIDYYVCAVINWRNICIDLFCGTVVYQLDEFRCRAMDYFKVTMPAVLPHAAILEPTIKTYDFEQCMNVFNIIRSGGTNKQIVQKGGVVGILANPIDGMGVHYMFQAVNGIAPVYFDEVFEKELKDRHIVIISNNLAENAIQDFFKTKIMVFNNREKFIEFVGARYGWNNTPIIINHYMSPETMIGD